MEQDGTPPVENTDGISAKPKTTSQKGKSGNKKENRKSMFNVAALKKAQAELNVGGTTSDKDADIDLNVDVRNEESKELENQTEFTGNDIDNFQNLDYGRDYSNYVQDESEEQSEVMAAPSEEIEEMRTVTTFVPQNQPVVSPHLHPHPQPASATTTHYLLADLKAPLSFESLLEISNGMLPSNDDLALFGIEKESLQALSENEEDELFTNVLLGFSGCATSHQVLRCLLWSILNKVIDFEKVKTSFDESYGALQSHHKENKDLRDSHVDDIKRLHREQIASKDELIHLLREKIRDVEEKYETTKSLNELLKKDNSSLTHTLQGHLSDSSNNNNSNTNKRRSVLVVKKSRGVDNGFGMASSQSTFSNHPDDDMDQFNYDGNTNSHTAPTSSRQRLALLQQQVLHSSSSK
jgi:hypothetical protein